VGCGQVSPTELSKELLNQLVEDFTVQSQNFELFEIALTKMGTPSLAPIMTKHLVSAVLFPFLLSIALASTLCCRGS
jgi:hypothetical protein